MNAHPSSLEGKTIVLRWNSKPNGDEYLTHVHRLLAQKVPTAKIANLKPDLVIASQAD